MKLRDLDITDIIQLIVYALLGENITVLGSRQVSDERILVQFVYTNHLDLGKEEKNLKLVLQEVFDLYPHIKFIETGQLINPVGLWII